MAHEEFSRIVPGAKRAVLFIHGIVGTPDHFRDLIPLEALVPGDWSVYNVLLDGHGKGTDEFAATSMKKWKAQVWDVFNSLAESHDEVVIAAHSMGTLFAIQLGLEYPEKIPLLFLLAVPMRPGLRLFGIGNMLRLVFGRIREDRPREAATARECGVATTRRLWKYLKWIPRYLELFAEIYRTEQILDQLKVPCVAYHSRKDELVANSARRVLEKSGVVDIVDLPESSHFYYAPADSDTVRKGFLTWCGIEKSTIV